VTAYHGQTISLPQLGGLTVTWNEWRGRLEPGEVADLVRHKLCDITLPAAERKVFLGMAAVLEDYLDAKAEERLDGDEEAS